MNTPSLPTSSSAIRLLLPEFDASGQSAAAFARARGIAVWRLHYALSRRSGKPRPPARPTRPSPRRTFIPVHVVDSTSPTVVTPLELVLAGGHRLRISAEFDADHLRRVVGALSRC